MEFVSPSRRHNRDLDLASRVLQMEKTVARLQSQSQVQEQTQATILSSVLSEFTSLKKNYTLLQAELMTVKDKLKTHENKISNLTDDLNKCSSSVKVMEKQLLSFQLKSESHANLSVIHEVTTELEMSRSNQNNITLRLSRVEEDITSNIQNLTNTLTDDVKFLSRNISRVYQLQKTNSESLRKIQNSMGRNQTDVHFSLTLKNSVTVKKANTIKFSPALENAVDGYNMTTGRYKIPVTGSYLFWITVLVSPPDGTIGMNIETTDGRIGTGYGITDLTVQSASYLKKGTEVWFQSWGDVTLNNLSRCGCALLNRFDD